MFGFLQSRPQDFWHALAMWTLAAFVLWWSITDQSWARIVIFAIAVVLGVWGAWLMREGLKEKKVI